MAGSMEKNIYHKLLLVLISAIDKGKLLVSPAGKFMSGSEILLMRAKTNSGIITTISYAIPQDGKVKITVYNSLGAKERELVNEFLSAGNYEIQFDGKNLPSGAYYCILESNNRMLTRIILLVK